MPFGNHCTATVSENSDFVVTSQKIRQTSTREFVEVFALYFFLTVCYACHEKVASPSFLGGGSNEGDETR